MSPTRLIVQLLAVGSFLLNNQPHCILQQFRVFKHRNAIFLPVLQPLEQQRILGVLDLLKLISPPRDVCDSALG